MNLEVSKIRVKLNVDILRNAKVSTFPFIDYFKGFEELEIVRRIFGEATKRVIKKLQIEFVGRRGYMGVSDIDGHLLICAGYLNNGDIVDIYLDVIHELVHVRQFIEGKKLFNFKKRYVERSTELEAYRFAVEEAKRLGLNDKRILEYLKTEWINDKDLRFLAKKLDVKL